MIKQVPLKFSLTFELQGFCHQTHFDFSLSPFLFFLFFLSLPLSLRTYLMNAYSKEERDQWIEAIHKATPVSPHMPRKDIKPSSGNSEKSTKPSADPKPAVSEKESGSKAKELTPPSYTMRQDTACDAALAAASCTDNSEEQRAIDEVRQREKKRRESVA